MDDAYCGCVFFACDFVLFYEKVARPVMLVDSMSIGFFGSGAADTSLLSYHLDMIPRVVNSFRDSCPFCSA